MGEFTCGKRWAFELAAPANRMTRRFALLTAEPALLDGARWPDPAGDKPPETGQRADSARDAARLRQARGVEIAFISSQA